MLYFIKLIPYCTSFSVLICIIIDPINLAAIKWIDEAGNLTNFGLNKTYDHINATHMNWIKVTKNEFIKTSDLYSSVNSNPRISSFKNAAKAIDVESGTTL
jgi:hypothetical protein